VQITSILAIYFLLWILSAFLMLPLGIKTHDEAGVEKVSGQADSAPANFRPGRVALRATILSAILCALYFANYHFGWITANDINLYGNGPKADQVTAT
jgi:predicted secreted protein